MSRSSNVVSGSSTPVYFSKYFISRSRISFLHLKSFVFLCKGSRTCITIAVYSSFSSRRPLPLFVVPKPSILLKSESSLFVSRLALCTIFSFMLSYVPSKWEVI